MRRETREVKGDDEEMQLGEREEQRDKVGGGGFHATPRYFTTQAYNILQVYSTIQTFATMQTCTTSQ